MDVLLVWTVDVFPWLLLQVFFCREKVILVYYGRISSMTPTATLKYDNRIDQNIKTRTPSKAVSRKKSSLVRGDCRGKASKAAVGRPLKLFPSFPGTLNPSWQKNWFILRHNWTFKTLFRLVGFAPTLVYCPCFSVIDLNIHVASAIFHQFAPAQ